MKKLDLDKNFVEINNFLLEEECDNQIKYIDNLFDINPDIEGLEIDGYNRLRISNNNLSKYVEKKLSKYYDVSDIYIGEKWFPTKYVRDGGLCIHTDGSAYDDKHESSYTIIIYLNDDYSGGRTVFVDDYDDEEIVKNDSIFVEPKKGKLLILKQDVLHFAEKISNGVKYILRGDIFINIK